MIKKTTFLLLIITLFFNSCDSGQVKNNPTSADKKSQAKAELDKSVYEQTMSSIDGQEIMPWQYKTIYIEHFNNNSYDSDAVSRLKEKLQNIFNRDGRLTTQTNKAAADVWLIGNIEALNKAPAAFDQFRRPTTYLYTGIVSIKVRASTKNGGQLILNKTVIRYDTRYSPRVPPFESQFEARERLFDTLTERILYTTFNGWYSNIKNNNELGYDPNADSNKTSNSAVNSETSVPNSSTDSTPKNENLLDYLKPGQ